MRLLVAHPIAITTAMTARNTSHAIQPEPVGLAQFADLTWLATDTTRVWLVPACWIAVGLYAFGLLPLVMTTFLLAVHIGFGTLSNSQGAIHHTCQIVGLVLLAQWVALLRPFFSKQNPKTVIRDYYAGWKKAVTDGVSSLSEVASRSSYGARFIRYSMHAVAAAYVVSAISKLFKSGGAWASNVPNIALQFEKNRQMAFYNTLEKTADGQVEPGMAMAQWVLQHPTVAGAMFGAGLLVELFAFLALLNRWFALAFGLGLIGLHTMISELMKLGFAFNKQLLAIFFINVPFWIAAVAIQRWRRDDQIEEAS